VGKAQTSNFSRLAVDISAGPTPFVRFQFHQRALETSSTEKWKNGQYTLYTLHMVQVQNQKAPTRHSCMIVYVLQKIGDEFDLFLIERSISASEFHDR
jgi:hypothetical protein